MCNIKLEDVWGKTNKQTNGENVPHLKLGKEFLHLIPQACSIKVKIQILDIIQIKTLFYKRPC